MAGSRTFRKQVKGEYRGCGWASAAPYVDREETYHVNGVLLDGPEDKYGEKRRMHIQLTIQDARRLAGFINRREITSGREPVAPQE